MIESYSGSLGSDIVRTANVTTKAVTGQELQFKDVPILRDYISEINGKFAKYDIVYDMWEESGRKDFSQDQTDRYHRALDFLVEEGHMDSDYAEQKREEFTDNQHFKDFGVTRESSAIKESIDANGSVEDVIEQMLGEEPTSQSETALRKLYGTYEVFGFENTAVNEMINASSNADKLQIMLDYRREAGDAAFQLLWDQGRENVRTASGRRTEILISDALDELIEDSI